MIGNFVIPIGDLMHELAEERRSETAALVKVVTKLEALVAGEELVSSFRAERPDEQIDKDLQSIRPSSESREKLVDSFAPSNRRSENMSTGINNSVVGSVDTQPLLIGDSNEEARQSERIRE